MKLLIITQKVDENDQLLGFFIDWLRRFAQKFEKLTVLCLEKGKYDLLPKVEVISLGKEKLENLKIENSLKIMRRILYGLRFYKYIWQMRREYDAVFVHMNPVWMVLGGMCWKMLGKKRFLWYTSGGVTLKLKVAEKFADVIFTASKESFRLKSNKVIITGHGIDTRLFRPMSRYRNVEMSKLKILSVGRIAPVKNYETLINAAKILKEEGINFEATMVGEAPLEKDKEYEESLKFKIKSLKLEENFNFVGKVNHKDLPQYYQAHDIFVHLSKTGSMDKVLLEAMACDIKFLSSNESFKVFLPADLIFDENDGVDLAGKIKNISKTDITYFASRQYVVNNHDLDNLVDKISKYIQQ